MKEIRFNFQPYEIESEFDGKPHAFTRAFWRGEEREFALALVDGWVRFCEVDKLKSGEWNFALSANVNSNPIEIDAEFLKRAFNSALRKEEIGRLLCLPPSLLLEHREKATQYVFIGVGNKGFVQGKAMRSIYSRMPLNIKSPFHIYTPLSITQSPVSHWYAEAKIWLEKDENDFSFSFRWNQLYDFEKSNLVMVSLNNHYDEMQEIAHLIISLQGNFFDKPKTEHVMSVVASFKLGASAAATKLESIGAYSGWGDRKIYQQQISYKLWEVFLRHFRPRINAELVEKYSALDLNDEYFWYLPTKTDDSILTAHERLEIRLKLADWLKGKVPDDQIDSLLA